MIDPEAVAAGRVAVSRPGWSWPWAGNLSTICRLSGFIQGDNGTVAVRDVQRWDRHPTVQAAPDPDDWRWEGYFLRLLSGGQVSARLRGGRWTVEWRGMWPLASGMGHVSTTKVGQHVKLGRACIQIAEALNAWPHGEDR